MTAEEQFTSPNLWLVTSWWGNPTAYGIVAIFSPAVAAYLFLDIGFLRVNGWKACLNKKEASLPRVEAAESAIRAVCEDAGMVE